MSLPKISSPKALSIALTFLLLPFIVCAAVIKDNAIGEPAAYSELNQDVSEEGFSFFAAAERFTNQVPISQDSIQALKTMAVKYGEEGNSQKAKQYILAYLRATADLSIINDHLFENIVDSADYKQLQSNYLPKYKPIAFFYLYVGFLGIFVFLILNIKKSKDRLSTFLISLFVLFHSIFILHLNLYVTNLRFYLTHTLFISTTFSFLYGPLLYFYFKRMNVKYKFRWVDSLHLIPSVALFLYILPFYTMSGLEKFQVAVGQSNWLLPGAHTIIVVKIVSLATYAFLIVRIYKKNRLKLTKEKDKNRLDWQRNLMVLHIVYLIAYVLYAAGLTRIIPSSLFFHFQFFVMAGVVFYVAYIVYEQPEIFKGKVKLMDPIKLFKYKKSGLTPSYSLELKESLVKLFDEEKVYKNNQLSLAILSERLGTTRHNTSQVINEHFNMNFFELVNTYRIGEAQEILKNDVNNNLNIIQVAYEVGFNNKVTFNKSFKKQVELTPTQYIKSLRN